VTRTLRWLGPDGTLAIVAVAVLATLAAALGGALQIPWDGIVPFLGIGAALFAASVIATRRLTGHARAVRLWAPFAVVYLCYRALRGAIPVLVDGGFEDALVRADVALLGASPAWALQAIHARWITELLAYAYATMFFLPLAVMLVLYARRADRELRHVALSLQLAFYLGFTIFLLVPARSPDVVFALPALEGYGFYERSMAAWRSLQAVTFDAFPSMHTAISTLALVHAFRFLPRWAALVMLPVVLLLQLATLYLQQHYFVDVVAGWAVAAIAIVLSRVLGDWAWAQLGKVELAVEHVHRRPLHQYVR
jgi:membrane-associated phospholipid phosphatase